MDNQVKKDLRLHTITQVDKIEPSTMYQGKYVIELRIEGVLKDRFFVSEKQARSVERVRRSKESFCVIDHGPEKGPRFVFASSNPEWLVNTFQATKETPVIADAIKAVAEMPATMVEADLPF